MGPRMAGAQQARSTTSVRTFYQTCPRPVERQQLYPSALHSSLLNPVPWTPPQGTLGRGPPVVDDSSSSPAWRVGQTASRASDCSAGMAAKCRRPMGLGPAGRKAIPGQTRLIWERSAGKVRWRRRCSAKIVAESSWPAPAVKESLLTAGGGSTQLRAGSTGSVRRGPLCNPPTGYGGPKSSSRAQQEPVRRGPVARKLTQRGTGHQETY